MTRIVPVNRLIAGSCSISGSGTVGALTASTDLASIWRYMNFGSGQTVGNQAVDSWLDNWGSNVISNTVADAGTTSLRLDAVSGSSAFGYMIGLPNNAKEGDKLWFSVRTYRPAGYLDTANPYLKFLRMHTFQADTGYDNGGYNDIYLNNDGHFHFIYEGEGTDGGVAENFASGSTAFHPVTGAWETWDYCVVFGTTPKSSGGLAEVFFWKNKVLIGHLTDRVTLGGSGYSVREIHHSTYWNGNAPANQSLYIGRYAVAAKIAGLRDDTSKLTTDAAGNPLIALNY